MDADPDPEPEPEPVTAPEAEKAPDEPAAPHPFERTHPDLDWPFAADIEVVLAHADAMNAAFAAGNEAGFAYMAATSWPDGFTADALLACRLREPTPTWAELDAMDHTYRFEIRGPIPVPGFQYPPTGEYPSASGLRPYLVYFVAERRVGDEVVNLFEDASRVAIRPDGTAVMFPTCFEFLPGEFLAHRVTDGHDDDGAARETRGAVVLSVGRRLPDPRHHVAIAVVDDLEVDAERLGGRGPELEERGLLLGAPEPGDLAPVGAGRLSLGEQRLRGAVDRRARAGRLDDVVDRRVGPSAAG